MCFACNASQLGRPRSCNLSCTSDHVLYSNYRSTSSFITLWKPDHAKCEKISFLQCKICNHYVLAALAVPITSRLLARACTESVFFSRACGQEDTGLSEWLTRWQKEFTLSSQGFSLGETMGRDMVEKRAIRSLNSAPLYHLNYEMSRRTFEHYLHFPQRDWQGWSPLLN